MILRRKLFFSVRDKKTHTSLMYDRWSPWFWYLLPFRQLGKCATFSMLCLENSNFYTLTKLLSRTSIAKVSQSKENSQKTLLKYKMAGRNKRFKMEIWPCANRCKTYTLVIPNRKRMKWRTNAGVLLVSSEIWRWRVMMRNLRPKSRMLIRTFYQI